MIVSFARDTIEIVTPTWVDDRGTLVPDYEHPDRVAVVAGCSVQPSTSTETLGDRQAVEARWTVYAPAELAVDAHDAVRWQGTLWQVHGAPAQWSSPTGVLAHTVLLLIDWSG